MPSPRAPRTLVTFAIVIGGFLLVAVMGALSGFIQGPWASGIFLAATLAVSLALGITWWLRIDEAAREAHKWAWWWGGSTGMLLCLIPLLLVSTELMPFDTTDLSFDLGVTSGVLMILAGQIAGYLVAWIWWWISKR